jgi:hypothetical protein
VFREVRLSVHAATDGRQIPWETSSLTTPFSFFEGPKEPAPSLALAAAETGSSTPRGGLDLGPEPTRESLAAMAPRDAYTLVIAWDRPEFYRLFLEVHGEDPLAMRVYRILSARVEEMSWAMAARWGDPAHLRRYAAVFAGSAHAMEARAMAAAGGAPAAKVVAICTPGAPKGIVDPAPVLRKASLVPPPRRTVTLRAAPRPRPRPAALPEVEEVESSGAPVHGAPSVTVGPFGPGIVGPRRPLPLPPFGEPGRPLRADGGPRPPRQPVPAGPATALPPDYSPGFARFIDAGRTRAGVPPTEPGPVARPSRPFLSPGESGGLR